MSEIFGRYFKAQRGVQALGALFVGMGLFLIISFVSHSPLDYPNSSRAAADGLNWGGRIGAHSSYMAFLAMGVAAYIWPLLLLFWGWNSLRYEPLISVAYRSIGLLGMALLFSIGAGLPAYSPHMAFKLGGLLGTQLSSLLLIPYMGRLGAAVLLGALFFAALILTTDVNLQPIARFLRESGHGVRRTAGRLSSMPGSLWGSWADWRVEQKEKKEAQRVEDREEDREDEGDLDDEQSLPAISRTSPVEPVVEMEEEPLLPVVEMEEEPLLPVVEMEEPLDERAVGEIVEHPAVQSAAEKKPAKRVKKDRVPTAVNVDQKNGKAASSAKKSGGRYKMPKVALLDEVPASRVGIDRDALLENARMLEGALDNFDVTGKVVEVSPGPVVTRYEVEPAAGVKVNRIVTLSDDLARIMRAKGIRIQAPVPGKSVVGIEIANQDRETVYLREILESKEFRQAESKLSMALGKTISGESYIADMAKMPHLLVAGATGAGKSVCINSLICSILFKSTPEEVRFLMVDPKVVELTMYNGIPHLLVPVITEPKKASEALKWAVAEMEARYQKLAKLGVRNLADYNRKLERVNAEAAEDGVEPEKAMPYIVIVIDEFADLMLTAPADVETSLMGLAQKSRAVGIHIILATQRPSVNVITGVIKANFPSRIAFQVASKTDSRTILDLNGAEGLLGRGDMLFLPGGQGEPIRIHGALITGDETERLVDAIKESNYETEEVEVFSGHADISTGSSDRDELFDDAVQLVLGSQQASTSFLQRRMKVGYSRAARLMDELENAGIVGPAEGAKPRQILVEDSEEMTGEGA
jgi:S-DNA-T family DNA segregation ATPase FtsK/SpoIIIE